MDDRVDIELHVYSASGGGGGGGGGVVNISGKASTVGEVLDHIKEEFSYISDPVLIASDCLNMEYSILQNDETKWTDSRLSDISKKPIRVRSRSEMLPFRFKSNGSCIFGTCNENMVIDPETTWGNLSKLLIEDYGFRSPVFVSTTYRDFRLENHAPEIRCNGDEFRSLFNGLHTFEVYEIAYMACMSSWSKEIAKSSNEVFCIAMERTPYKLNIIVASKMTWKDIKQQIQESIDLIDDTSCIKWGPGRKFYDIQDDMPADAFLKLAKAESPILCRRTANVWVTYYVATQTHTERREFDVSSKFGELKAWFSRRYSPSEGFVVVAFDGGRVIKLSDDAPITAVEAEIRELGFIHVIPCGGNDFVIRFRNNEDVEYMFVVDDKATFGYVKQQFIRVLDVAWDAVKFGTALFRDLCVDETASASTLQRFIALEGKLRVVDARLADPPSPARGAVPSRARSPQPGGSAPPRGGSGAGGGSASPRPVRVPAPGSGAGGEPASPRPVRVPAPASPSARGGSGAGGGSDAAGSTPRKYRYFAPGAQYMDEKREKVQLSSTVDKEAMQKMIESEKLFLPDISAVSVPGEGVVGSVLNNVARVEHLLPESLCLVDMYGKLLSYQDGHAWDDIPSHVHVCGLYMNEHAATLTPFRFSFMTDARDNPVSVIDVTKAGDTLESLKGKITSITGFGSFDIHWGQIRLSNIGGAVDSMHAGVILALACGRMPLVKQVGEAVRRGDAVGRVLVRRPSSPAR